MTDKDQTVKVWVATTSYDDEAATAVVFANEEDALEYVRLGGSDEASECEVLNALPAYETRYYAVVHLVNGERTELQGETTHFDPPPHPYDRTLGYSAGAGEARYYPTADGALAAARSAAADITLQNRWEQAGWLPEHRPPVGSPEYLAGPLVSYPQGSDVGLRIAARKLLAEPTQDGEPA